MVKLTQLASIKFIGQAKLSLPASIINFIGHAVINKIKGLTTIIEYAINEFIMARVIIIIKILLLD